MTTLEKLKEEFQEENILATCKSETYLFYNEGKQIHGHCSHGRDCCEFGPYNSIEEFVNRWQEHLDEWFEITY